MRMKKRLTFLLTALLVVSSIWAQTFQNGDLTYNVIYSGDIGNFVEVTKGDYSNLTEIVIPSTVTNEGVEYAVTSIENNAFDRCDNLTSVVISENVTTIGYCCFWNCYNLTSIKLPSSLTSIEFLAFYGCRNLEKIVIPENVADIGSTLFYECPSLYSITVKAMTPPTAQNGLIGLTEYLY